MADAIAMAGETNQSICPESVKYTSHVVDGHCMCDENIKPESDQKVKSKEEYDDRFYEPGVAPIKMQYLKKVSKIVKGELESQVNTAEECSDEKQGETNNLASLNHSEGNFEEPPHKKVKVRGMNKNRSRHLSRTDPNKKICPAIIRETECSYGDRCKFIHDVGKYMASKLPDIGNICVNYEKFGKCPYGVSCRYGSSHITEDLKNRVNKKSSGISGPKTVNSLTKELQTKLRKKKYKFSKSDEYLMHLNDVIKNEKPLSELGKVTQSCQIKTLGALTDEGTIRLLPDEKSKIDFSDKLYLAPLTTVGNLPYRRICKTYGADITCSEMAVCTNLLQGHQSEWALLKRHHSEDLFGVQLCGSFPDSMTKCAELLQHEIQVDFVDVNLGCPIDLVFNKGGGCALMGRMSKFEQIIRGMNHVLDIPLTVKMRAGIHDKKHTWNAHKIIPSVRGWGASLVTLHGRSREQRYTRSADWDYIDECAKAASPMPFFGNGDILSYEDANLRKELTGVSGVMIARGALIKPWIFTEIKEQRHWDISSSERLEMLKEYVNFGLEHWGSDTQGVENVRRFLLEWLSFLHRYIPVGLLERLPQRINERPPPFYGRNDLETLMASSKSNDWVKISEMLLGPVPSDFSFIPKHKANSYTQGEG